MSEPATCPHIVHGDEGTQHCDLAETEVRRLSGEVEQLRAAILDIDAHAAPMGSDESGFVSGGYIISVGSLHRALGLVGHSAVKVTKHAVWLEMAHPDCEACTKVKDIALDALRRPSSEAARSASSELGGSHEWPCPTIQAVDDISRSES